MICEGQHNGLGGGGWSRGSAEDFLGKTKPEMISDLSYFIGLMLKKEDHPTSADKPQLKDLQRYLRVLLREVAAEAGIPVRPDWSRSVPCMECGKIMRIHPLGRRSNSRYCDAACRQAACRRRKAEACKTRK